MFIIDSSKTIHLTRGDIAVIEVTANISKDQPYVFLPGDLIRFKIMEKDNMEMVILQKDFPVIEETITVDISLTSEDTSIGTLINEPNDYWYEIELNPGIDSQTLIGYDLKGGKIFRLYPEGGVLE